MLMTLLSSVIAEQPKLFNLKSFKLENGLEVIVVPNKVSSVAAVGILYKVGSADDPQNIVGVSHFLEHMMFKGTKNVPGETIKKDVASFGGMANAATSCDWTFYYTVVAPIFLDYVLKNEADRMRNLAYTEEEVVTERDVIMQERLMRLENNPFGYASELLLRNQYLHHPYGTTIIGHPEHIRGYNFQNTRACYERWYAPNNAVLVVVGNVDFEQVKELVNRYFSSIQPSKDLDKERTRPQEPKISKTTRFIIQKNERNSMVLSIISYPAPCRRDVKDLKEIMAYWIGSYILGGNDISLFFDYFVMQKRQAVSVTTDYEFGYDPKKFEVQVTLTPTMDFKDFYRSYKAYVKDLTQHFIETDAFKIKFEQAKKQLIGSLKFQVDSSINILFYFTKLAYGWSLDEITSIEKHINDVQLEDVQKALKKIFSDDPDVVLVVSPVDYSLELL